MILGIGVDSIEISRVVKAMEKEHFVHRIFTEKERAEMEHAKRRGASDFAGKEAVVKAFGTIVSQKYHLYRALYVAERLGLDAYGVSADLRPYAGQEARELREVLARNKDFFTAIVQPPPTFLGDPISLSGSASVTEG